MQQFPKLFLFFPTWICQNHTCNFSSLPISLLSIRRRRTHNGLKEEEGCYAFVCRSDEWIDFCIMYHQPRCSMLQRPMVGNRILCISHALWEEYKGQGNRLDFHGTPPPRVFFLPFCTRYVHCVLGAYSSFMSSYYNNFIPWIRKLNFLHFSFKPLSPHPPKSRVILKHQ